MSGELGAHEDHCSGRAVSAPPPQPGTISKSHFLPSPPLREMISVNCLVGITHRWGTLSPQTPTLAPNWLIEVLTGLSPGEAGNYSLHSPLACTCSFTLGACLAPRGGGFVPSNYRPHTNGPSSRRTQQSGNFQPGVISRGSFSPKC